MFTIVCHNVFIDTNTGGRQMGTFSNAVVPLDMHLHHHHHHHHQLLKHKLNSKSLFFCVIVCERR